MSDRAAPPTVPAIDTYAVVAEMPPNSAPARPITMTLAENASPTRTCGPTPRSRSIQAI